MYLLPFCAFAFAEDARAELFSPLAMERVFLMKVIVLTLPRFARGFLKKIFKIR